MKKAEVIEVIPSRKIIVGDKSAPVTLMQFGDYESEACARAHEVVKALLEKFPGQVNFNFRHFPLVKVHQKAHKAAEASLAAAQEGRFWEMHNELFANRHTLGVISLKGHAREAGVKAKKFLDMLIDGFFGIYIQDDLKEGLRLGVTEVPSFFFNGERYTGKTDLKSMTAHVRQLLGEKTVKSAA